MELTRERFFELARLADNTPEDFRRQEEAVRAEFRHLADKPSLESRTTVIGCQIAEEIIRDKEGKEVGRFRGAVVGADSRVSTMSEALQVTFKKLYEIDPFSILGISGLASSGQFIARGLELELQRFARRFHHAHPKSKANRLASWLRGFGFLHPLFVTADFDEGRARFFTSDPSGALSEHKGYAAIGYGSSAIRSELRSMARKIAKKSPAEAIADIVYLLRQAAFFDQLHTGGDFFIHLLIAEGVSPPIVVKEKLWKFDEVLEEEEEEDEMVKLQIAVLMQEYLLQHYPWLGPKPQKPDVAGQEGEKGGGGS